MQGENHQDTEKLIAQLEEITHCGREDCQKALLQTHFQLGPAIDALLSGQINSKESTGQHQHPGNIASNSFSSSSSRHHPESSSSSNSGGNAQSDEADITIVRDGRLSGSNSSSSASGGSTPSNLNSRGRLLGSSSTGFNHDDFATTNNLSSASSPRSTNRRRHRARSNDSSSASSRQRNTADIPQTMNNSSSSSSSTNAYDGADAVPPTSATTRSTGVNPATNGPLSGIIRYLGDILGIETNPPSNGEECARRTLRNFQGRYTIPLVPSNSFASTTSSSMSSTTSSEQPRFPRFQESSFRNALVQAHSEHKFLFIYLHSRCHSYTDFFCRNVIFSSEFLTFTNSPQSRNSFNLWTGDVSYSEPYSVAKALQVTSFPFIALLLPMGGSKCQMVYYREGLLKWENALVATSHHRSNEGNPPRSSPGGLGSHDSTGVSSNMPNTNANASTNGSPTSTAAGIEECRTVIRALANNIRIHGVRLQEQRNAVVERQQRTSLIEQQKREYEQTLARDKKREEQEREERERAATEEEALEQAELENALRMSEEESLREMREEWRTKFETEWQEPTGGNNKQTQNSEQQPQQIVEILLKFPNGKRSKRRFLHTDRIELLRRFTSVQFLVHDLEYIGENFQTFSDIQLANKVLLIVIDVDA
eukprot:g2514.t1